MEGPSLDPIQLWGALGAVVVILLFALMAFLRDWVVPGSRYKECREDNKRLQEEIAKRDLVIREERERRESVQESASDKMDKLRDSLELKLQESNRLLLEATATFQRMRRR